MSIMDKWKREIDRDIANEEYNDKYFEVLLAISNKIVQFSNKRNKYVRLLLIAFANPLREGAIYYFSKKPKQPEKVEAEKFIKLERGAFGSGTIYGINKKEKEIADRYKLNAVERKKLQDALDEMDEERRES